MGALAFMSAIALGLPTVADLLLIAGICALAVSRIRYPKPRGPLFTVALGAMALGGCAHGDGPRVRVPETWR
jgi:hypothetical protein